MLYNIAPGDNARRYTADEIRAAARNGLQLWLNVGTLQAPIPCRLASNVNGWCTVVLTSGGIVQDWAGYLSIRCEEG